MRDYATLTPGGQVRRLRPAIDAGLDRFGLTDAPTRVLQHSENTVLRVDASCPGADPRYRPDRLVLRIHGPDYQTPSAVAAEMAWLAALAALAAAGLAVPQPVAARSGALVATVKAPGALGPRSVTMLRWVRGRRMHQPPTPRRYRDIGELVARLHEHSAGWEVPPGFERHTWDWEGFFGDTIPFAGTAAAECWEAVPQPQRRRWRATADAFGVATRTIGRERGVFGLIHADPHYGNLLSHRGEMRPVDFDDCGWGWYLYDYVVALGASQRLGPNWDRVYDEFWEGYARHRPVPESLLGHLDLFFAARAISLSLWEFGMIRINPEFIAYAAESVDFVENLLDALEM